MWSTTTNNNLFDVWVCILHIFSGLLYRAHRCAMRPFTLINQSIKLKLNNFYLSPCATYEDAVVEEEEEDVCDGGGEE